MDHRGQVISLLIKPSALVPARNSCSNQIKLILKGCSHFHIPVEMLLFAHVKNTQYLHLKTNVKSLPTECTKRNRSKFILP